MYHVAPLCVEPIDAFFLTDSQMKRLRSATNSIAEQHSPYRQRTTPRSARSGIPSRGDGGTKHRRADPVYPPWRGCKQTATIKKMDEPARLLVVDDDTHTLRAMTRVLRHSARFDVHGAATITDAVDVAGRVNPDIGLFDLQLGDGELADLVRAIFADQATRFPFVVYSGRPPREVQAASRDAGADAWVLKGTPTSEIMEILYAALGWSSVPPDRLVPDSESWMAILRRASSSPLSRREEEALMALLALRPLLGLDRRSQIALELGLERETVVSHLRRSFRKLRVTNTEDLLRLIATTGGLGLLGPPAMDSEG